MEAKRRPLSCTGYIHDAGSQHFSDEPSLLSLCGALAVQTLTHLCLLKKGIVRLCSHARTEGTSVLLTSGAG